MAGEAVVSDTELTETCTGLFRFLLPQGSGIYSESAAANYGSVDIFSQVHRTLPTKRLGTVEEISAVVCFLLSPAAAFISGDTVYVDGGGRLYQTMWQVPGQCVCVCVCVCV